jgi:hypothetical protein
MTEKKTKHKICIHCKKTISTKQGAWVLIGTYNRPSKPDHEGYFHFPCFVDWFNESVREKAFGMIEQRSNILSLIGDPKLQKLAANILQDTVGEKKVTNGTKAKRTKGKKKN